MILVFRNSVTTRPQNEIYNNNDYPCYYRKLDSKELPNTLKKSTDLQKQEYYVNVMTNTITVLKTSLIRFCPTVNEKLEIVSYYDDECNLITVNEPLTYEKYKNSVLFSI